MTAEFTIDCSGNVCRGDHIFWTEPVWDGYSKYGRNTPDGERTIEAVVIKCSYGADQGQHTFSLEVKASAGYEPVPVGKTIRRKARKIYRCGVMRKRWENESERLAVLHEKYGRGRTARAERAYRREVSDHY